MTSRNRSGNTVEAGVSPAWQSGSQPTRLPLQRDDIKIRRVRLADAPALLSWFQSNSDEVALDARWLLPRRKILQDEALPE
jgi:hypothetical protein